MSVRQRVAWGAAALALVASVFALGVAVGRCGAAPAQPERASAPVPVLALDASVELLPDASLELKRIDPPDAGR
jgi:hypothetical protein